ncbi:MAG TPA: galactokinase [Bacteroidota bacterium]|nr:galactokinase [Bacteroidota bacterium]
MNIDYFIQELKKNPSKYIDEIKNIYQCDDNSALEYLNLYNNLLTEFKTLFPESKEIGIIRAPGRVNLIGEHTDYNALPVLPIAIDKNIIIIFSPVNDSTIRIYNHDPGFEYREFEISENTKPYETGDWGNYVKAGVLWNKEKGKKGFNALIYGDIPSAAGLSSSSALVVASALTFLQSNNINPDLLLLADELAKAEQYVGTMGGGMDQTISLLGKENKALQINFHPLSVKEVVIPNEICFVVINSLVKAPKTKNARLKYNRRPIECKIALDVVNKYIVNRFNSAFNYSFIGNLVKNFPSFNQNFINDILDNVLNKESYSTAQIVNILGIDEEQFKDKYLLLKDGSYFDEPTDGFKLRQRFQYVIEEGLRVSRAVDALENNNITLFGKLMVDSYFGARDLYEISTPEIDFLVREALKCGAIGSRLTGAGFGGCVINLIYKKDAHAFLEKMKDLYFFKYIPETHPEISVNKNIVDNYIFICKPCRGAGLILS